MAGKLTIAGRGHRPGPFREANMLGVQRRLHIAPALRALAAALPPLYHEKHRPPRAVAAVEGVWGERLSPHISSYGNFLTLSASVVLNLLCDDWYLRSIKSCARAHAFRVCVRV